MAKWRKSTRSNDEGACVELSALSTGEVGVRDSKHPERPHLAVTTGQLSTLVAAIKADKHTL